MYIYFKPIRKREDGTIYEIIRNSRIEQTIIMNVSTGSTYVVESFIACTLSIFIVKYSTFYDFTIGYEISLVDNNMKRQK